MCIIPIYTYIHIHVYMYAYIYRYTRGQEAVCLQFSVLFTDV